MRKIRVCYFGTYRSEYSRNRIMIEGLRRNGVDVIECHYQLWHGIEDRLKAASGYWLHPRFILRTARAYLNLIIRFLKIRDIDIVMIGYPGLPDVLLARILTWVRRKPLVWDIFMSVYLVGEERGPNTFNRITREFIHKLERISCSLPDRLIIDTRQYIQWFHDHYEIHEERFRLVPTGADNRYFKPIPSDHGDQDVYYVTYHGTFIPNHGIPYIIEAAKLLTDHPNIHFELIGDGPAYNEARRLANSHNLENITFYGWLLRDELIPTLAKSDLILGAFGTTPQSIMTIQNKIFESLAMAKPTITGDSEVVREVFEHGTHIYLCEREDPQALAEAIKTVVFDRELCKKLSNNGYQIFMEKYTLDMIGSQCLDHLIEILGPM